MRDINMKTVSLVRNYGNGFSATPRNSFSPSAFITRDDESPIGGGSEVSSSGDGSNTSSGDCFKAATSRGGLSSSDSGVTTSLFSPLILPLSSLTQYPSCRRCSDAFLRVYEPLLLSILYKVLIYNLLKR